jgi:DNA-binding HxlR family transcriptional regulator
MTRNELVLAALAGGEASTATIAQLTGLSERVCRYRFRWLIKDAYAWSPERGRYRLTARGRALAAEVPPLEARREPVTAPAAGPGAELRDRHMCPLAA